MIATLSFIVVRKAQQFGLQEVQAGQERNNLERLLSEFHDLVATFENFLSQVGKHQSALPNHFQRQARLEKMAKFLDLAIRLNQVDADVSVRSKNSGQCECETKS